jgi:hypothetical protein
MFLRLWQGLGLGARMTRPGRVRAGCLTKTSRRGTPHSCTTHSRPRSALTYFRCRRCNQYSLAWEGRIPGLANACDDRLHDDNSPTLRRRNRRSRRRARPCRPATLMAAPATAVDGTPRLWPAMVKAPQRPCPRKEASRFGRTSSPQHFRFADFSFDPEQHPTPGGRSMRC